MKVILADDHALFREGFVLLLRQMQEGAEIVTAADLGEALAQVRRHPDAELLLLDLNMPGIDGVDSVAEVMRGHPDLPIAILSAEEERDRVEHLLAAGVSGYIPKSSSPRVMVSAIRLILAGGIYVPPQLLRFETDITPDSTPLGIKPIQGALRLTERQIEVLRLIVEGMSNKQVCRELGLGEGTVKAHLAAIFRALDVRNRTEAATAARRLGVIE
jgi:DNA-binding NarL/FixJ family response regulator